MMSEKGTGMTGGGTTYGVRGERVIDGEVGMRIVIEKRGLGTMLRCAVVMQDEIEMAKAER